MSPEQPVTNDQPRLEDGSPAFASRWDRPGGVPDTGVLPARQSVLAPTFSPLPCVPPFHFLTLSVVTTRSVIPEGDHGEED